MLETIVYAAAGLAFLGMSYLIHRRGIVAEPYGGEKFAPAWAVLSLVSGLVFLGAALSGLL